MIIDRMSPAEVRKEVHDALMSADPDRRARAAINVSFIIEESMLTRSGELHQAVQAGFFMGMAPLCLVGLAFLWIGGR